MPLLYQQVFDASFVHFLYELAQDQ